MSGKGCVANQELYVRQQLTDSTSDLLVPSRVHELVLEARNIAGYFDTNSDGKWKSGFLCASEHLKQFFISRCFLAH